MNSQPDVKRSYESPLRKAQAAATRRAIIDAAAASFIEYGYVATSIEMIAQAAKGRNALYRWGPTAKTSHGFLGVGEENLARIRFFT